MLSLVRLLTLALLRSALMFKCWQGLDSLLQRR